MIWILIEKLLLVFLPPANEVWGKVIFSESFVILSTVHGGGDLCMMSLLVWLPVSMSHQGISVPGPMFLLGALLCPGGLCPGGSTGMLYCF